MINIWKTLLWDLISKWPECDCNKYEDNNWIWQKKEIVEILQYQGKNYINGLQDKWLECLAKNIEALTSEFSRWD